MKNKLIKILSFVLCLIITITCLTACTEKNDVKNEIKSSIEFVGFTKVADKGLLEEYKIIVPKETKNFAISDYIKITGDVEWYVTKDLYGEDNIPNRIISLNQGDNYVYLTTKINNSYKTYCLNIKIRRNFNVKFHYKYQRPDTSIMDGLTDVVFYTTTVEEDSCVAVPEGEPTESGYTFIKWDFDFNTPITADTDIYAIMEKQ